MRKRIFPNDLGGVYIVSLHISPKWTRSFSLSRSEFLRIHGEQHSSKKYLKFLQLSRICGLRNAIRIFWRGRVEERRRDGSSEWCKGPSSRGVGRWGPARLAIPGRLHPVTSVSGTPPSWARSPAAGPSRFHSSHPLAARRGPHLLRPWEQTINGIGEQILKVGVEFMC